MDRILAQLKNRNYREKKDIPTLKRTVYKRVHKLIYETTRAPIMLGLRRVGKTTIFRQILEQDTKAFIVPFDDLSIRRLSDLELVELFQTLYDEGYRVFLIDEAQDLPEWDTKIFGLINSFKDAKFAITGSSSLNIAKKETGLDRTEVVNISTLTFDEYLLLKQIKRENLKNDELKIMFENFLGTGGFPQYINRENSIETIYELRENILKDLIDNDISRTFSNVKANIMNELLNKLSNLTNGEVNKANITQGIDRFTQREFDEYMDIFEQARIIKKIYRTNENGDKPKREKYKVYLNPHIHLWLLEANFSNLDGKRKGHIIESYWLTWVDSVNRSPKKLYYIKNKKNEEVDFVSFNPNGSFKTLHEFKYSYSVSINSLFESIKSNRKIIWCLEDKESNNIKYISLLNVTDEEGSKY